MDVSPAITEVGDQFPPAEDTEQDEDEDLCRICRSPEEPGNPLRYPCLCRGSIKYVHEDCLRRWLNRKDDKKCEVCGRTYSFVPLYSENAPERLPCREFLKGVLARTSFYTRMIVPWVLAFLWNTFCFSLHPFGRRVAADFQRDFGISSKFAYLSAGLFYHFCLVAVLTIITIIREDAEDRNARRVLAGFRAEILRMEVEDHNVRRVLAEFRAEILRMDVEDRNVRRVLAGFRAEILPSNGLQQGVIGVVVQVLWKYMKILSDWYFLKLIHFTGQPRRLIFYPRYVSFHEFGVIRKLHFFLDDDAFAAFVISVSVSFFFVLLPFSIGWTVLATTGGSYLSRISPVILGYMMMLLMSFADSGILFILRPNSFPAIVRWCALGFHFMTVNLPCLLWNFSVNACKNLFYIKGIFVVYFKFGVQPWLVGWWLEICISDLFGTTITQRFLILSIFPTSVFIRWMLGFFYFMNVEINMEFIQKIIHRRAFWYLIDITDLDYKIMELNLGYTLFAFASHGVLLVIMFLLPMKATTLIIPSVFPLKLWIVDEYPLIAIGVYMNLIIHGSHWLNKHIELDSEPIMHNWIVTVSSWLKLSDFLLVVPRGEGFHQNEIREISFLLYSLAEGCIVISRKSQNAEGDIKDQTNNRFLPRIALMWVLAALSMGLCYAAFSTLPILAGRIFLESVSFIIPRFGIKHDDFCAFWIGCGILRAIYISICFIIDHIQKGRTDLLVRYVYIRIRNGLFFSIWIFVIPGLLGVLIDLMIIIPSRVPLNESPVYFLIQDWLIGVVVLHIWTFLTMFTPINWFASEAWRRKLKRIKNVGINSLPSVWLLKDVIGSIVDTLLTTLCIPYLLVKSLFPVLGFSQSINSAIERLIWPALLALITVWFVVKLTRDLIVHLHQLVFNERYVVGERVDNFTEDHE